MSDSAMRSGPDGEWEDLMNQLRARSKSQPAPFFYTRVRARLDGRGSPGGSWLPVWLRRPAYAALLGAVMLLLSGDGAALPAAKAGPYPRTANQR